MLFRLVQTESGDVIVEASSHRFFECRGKMAIAESAEIRHLALGHAVEMLRNIKQCFFDGLGHDRLGVEELFLVPIAEDSHKDLQNICPDAQLEGGSSPIPFLQYLKAERVNVDALEILSAEMLLVICIRQKRGDVFELEERIVVKIQHSRGKFDTDIVAFLVEGERMHFSRIDNEQIARHHSVGDARHPDLHIRIQRVKKFDIIVIVISLSLRAIGGGSFVAIEAMHPTFYAVDNKRFFRKRVHIKLLSDAGQFDSRDRKFPRAVIVQKNKQIIKI